MADPLHTGTGGPNDPFVFAPGVTSIAAQAFVLSQLTASQLTPNSPFVSLASPMVPPVPGVPAMPAGFTLGDSGGITGAGTTGSPFVFPSGTSSDSIQQFTSNQATLQALVGPVLSADSPSISRITGAARWGIFTTGGQSILQVDSVADIEYHRDYRISKYPQEQGAFASYNKVQTPFDSRVTFLIAQSRASFLQQVEAAVKSLKFVTVVTPEISYPSANLTGYSYHREVRRGVTMIAVEVTCEEVRIVSTSTSTSAQTGQGAINGQNTASTNGATTQNDGSVQTTPGQGTAPLVSGQPVPQTPTLTGSSDTIGEPIVISSAASTMSTAAQTTILNQSVNQGVPLVTISPTDAFGNTNVFPGTL